MAESYWNIPELSARATGSIRLPFQNDVPVTTRVKKLIDTTAFQRLSQISQLGLVSSVYPGATHTRFAHSIGVFGLAVEYLRVLYHDSNFRNAVDKELATATLLASLLHDIGHWPYCHLIEDLNMAGISKHETLATEFILSDEIADLLTEEWQIDPKLVVSILNPLQSCCDSPNQRIRIASSVLSGPIDIDKMDYLERDSLAAGVPYGRNFDRVRLIDSLCFDPESCQLAIDRKGRTAAELMVFARYVMFSEVYWHHAVRSATAMLQRCLLNQLSPLSSVERGREVQRWQTMNDVAFQQNLLQLAGSHCRLANGSFGPNRRLFKRAGQFNAVDHPELHARLSHRPQTELVAICKQLAVILSNRFGHEFHVDDILLDASPVDLEVQFRVTVRSGEGKFQPLSELSPVVRVLADEQFDAVVKQVRLFVLPEWATEIRALPVADLIEQADLEVAQKSSGE